jgi:hypothetical protein
MSKKTQSMGLGLNLDDFNKTSHRFLSDEPKVEVTSKKEQKVLDKKAKTEKKVTTKTANVVAEEKSDEKEDKKLGRPMIEGELLNKKLISSVTEEEYEKVIKKAGLVSVSTYLRTQMREAGII